MSQAPEIQTTDFSKDTDADLLTMISWKQEDDDGAREAWGEFYRRHFTFLSFVCLKFYGRQLGDAGVEDLVNETFLHVFAKAAQGFRPGDDSDAQVNRRHVESWLRTVAHNVFLMDLRGRRRDPNTMLYDIDVAMPTAPTMSAEREEQCQRVREVIESLPERERDVLFARFWNYDRAGGKQTFAPEVLADLIDRWETTDANIRKILSRTLKKIKERLS